MSDNSLKDVLDDLRNMADLDFSVARSAPPSMYHHPDLLPIEVKNIFKKEWICVGRSEEIQQAGDFLTYEIIDQPIFVIRQSDGSIEAFANVCAHRCAKLLHGKGRSDRIRCPYHSWTYALDGKLIAAPYMDETANFNKSDYRLAAIRSEIWEGFIYVTLNDELAPVADRLQGLHKIVAQYQMADYEPVFEGEEVWNTNWKCLVENFMDAMHIHRVHKETFAKNGNSENRTTCFAGGEYFTYHQIDGNPDSDRGFAHESNTWLGEEYRSRILLLCLFPNHTIQLQPDLLWYLSIIPQGTGQVRIKWRVSIPQEILENSPDREAHIAGVKNLLTKVNSEDRPVVEGVFEATASGLAKPGLMSYLERNVYEFDRYLARQLLKEFR
ncbi:MAG: choline monooxygenase [Parasphingorhabdus sp.]|jgi:choline monooxygenase